MISLPYDSYYKDGTLYHGWNCGFFSNASTCLWNLVKLQKDHGIAPERIDFSNAFCFFKTEKEMAEKADIYPTLYQFGRITPNFAMPRTCNHHSLYRQQDIHALSSFVTKYFMPSDKVLEIENMLCSKYGIDTAKTLVICIRGTDKRNEIRSAGPECYLKKCEQILRRNPQLRVWIQTDQEQYVEYFSEALREQVFFIDELPRSRGSKSIHEDPQLKFDRLEFRQSLIAVVHLMAQCHTIISHTGNVGYWIALYRGGLDRFYQETTHFFYDKKSYVDGRFNQISLEWILRKKYRQLKQLVLKPR